MKTTFVTPVPLHDVLKTAISLVKRAKQNVTASQSPFDASPVKPSNEYFSAVENAIKNGVKFKRYCFGQRPAERVDSRGVQQFYAGTQKYYQRVLIIDRTTAMFKLGENFYYTEYQPLVIALTQYVTQGSDVRKVSSAVYKDNSGL